MAPSSILDVIVTDKEGAEKIFKVKLRLDTPVEVEYYRNGGILHTVLRNMIRST